MHTRRSRLMLTTALAVAALSAVALAHVPLQPPGSIYVLVDLSAAGRPYAAKGQGECNYAPIASIYQAPGQMWSVRQHDTSRDVNLALWRLKGGDSFTLSVTIAGQTHRVNTLPVVPAADRRGSGKVTVATYHKGGQFQIDAVADTGMKITGTLGCSGFMAPEDNGD